MHAGAGGDTAASGVGPRPHRQHGCPRRVCRRRLPRALPPRLPHLPCPHHGALWKMHVPSSPYTFAPFSACLVRLVPTRPALRELLVTSQACSLPTAQCTVVCLHVSSSLMTGPPTLVLASCRYGAVHARSSGRGTVGRSVPRWCPHPCTAHPLASHGPTRHTPLHRGVSQATTITVCICESSQVHDGGRVRGCLFESVGRHEK